MKRLYRNINIEKIYGYIKTFCIYFQVSYLTFPLHYSSNKIDQLMHNKIQ